MLNMFIELLFNISHCWSVVDITFCLENQSNATIVSLEGPAEPPLFLKFTGTLWHFVTTAPLQSIMNFEFRVSIVAFTQPAFNELLVARVTHIDILANSWKKNEELTMWLFHSLQQQSYVLVLRQGARPFYSLPFGGLFAMLKMW